MTASLGSTPAFTQLSALVGLRLTMVRSGRARAGFVLLLLAVPAALLGAGGVGQLLPQETAFRLSLLAPTIFLGFALLSLLSPLSAGGGQDLYPEEQLVAMPVRASTQFLSGLVVLPLNLAWMAQLLAVSASSFLLLTPSRYTPGAVLLLALFVLAVSAIGQFLTWVTIGMRRRRSGRRLVWVLAALVGALVITAARLVGVAGLLDNSPTTAVVVAVLQAGSGSAGSGFWATAAGLALIALTGLALGWRACGWALRRAGDAGVFTESRPLPRPPDGAVSLQSVDRSGVWRSPSLRRGVLVLGLLPGGIAALLGVDWLTLLLLPGLVAAGAGLLFGVNAFCLDGTGAVWLSSLPHDPRLAIRAKTRVIAETCLACTGIAVVAAVVRVDRLPSTAELSALLCAIVVTTASVVATCLRFSTTRPHKAELRGPRDTPAPPGAMAVYSLRLAVSTTFLGLLLAGSAHTGVWWLPWLLVFPVLLLALRRMLAAWGRWDDTVLRAGIVSRVSSG